MTTLTPPQVLEHWERLHGAAFGFWPPPGFHGSRDQLVVLAEPAWYVAVANLNKVGVTHDGTGWVASDGDPRPERTGRGSDWTSAMRDWCIRNEVQIVVRDEQRGAA